ncbi:hypothetical protein EVAR_37274_1 [Eumeta japonica]|uniref:Uncharacterized protein n=1 Tax=Eumeta variegata TaxID=151549 RepID=A0A4C1WJ43_EUMVA|nr:hypothetical protein EVAR_37274_1 [Eumeta japonica]
MPHSLTWQFQLTLYLVSERRIGGNKNFMNDTRNNLGRTHSPRQDSAKCRPHLCTRSRIEYAHAAPAKWCREREKKYLRSPTITVTFNAFEVEPD